MGGYSVTDVYRTNFLKQVASFVEWFEVEGELTEDD